MDKWNEYNPDLWAEEITRNYKEMDKKALELTSGAGEEYKTGHPLLTVWDLECNELLYDLGLGDPDYRIKLLPEKKLKILFSKYRTQNLEVDDYGHIVPKDPLPGYAPESNNVRKELFSLGRTLGLLGELGKYFYLITDINFSRGLWLGQVEKAVADNDLDALNQVKNDMEFFKIGSSDAEFERVRKKMYSLNEDTDELELRLLLNKG